MPEISVGSGKPAERSQAGYVASPSLRNGRYAPDVLPLLATLTQMMASLVTIIVVTKK